MAKQTEADISKQLVERILAKDESAEKEMVDRYQKGLLFLLKRKSNEDIAQDVSQDTWKLIIEKVRGGELRDPTKLSAFIVQTGRNQLIMHFRRQKDSVSWDELPDADAHIEVNSCTPQSSHEAFQQQQWVRNVVAELNTSRDREILTRYYLNEEEKRDICNDLDLSDIHFNRVLFRAKQRLKSHVEQKKQELAL